MNRLLMPLILSLVLALPVHAGLFGSKKKDEAPPGPSQAMRRYVLNVPDKNTERELTELLGGRQRVTQQLAVLQQLIVEKQGENQRFERELERDFGIRRAGRYYYDRAAKTLFELVPLPTNAPADAPAAATAVEAVGTNDAAAAAARASGFDKKFFRQLRGQEEGDRFGRMVASRDAAAMEVRVFNAVVREKNSELQQLNERLGAKFSLQPNSMYYYDPKTMILYEMVQPNRAAPRLGAAPASAPARR